MMNEPVSSNELNPERLKDLIRQNPNPYEALLDIPSPSLLDIGAGDLTFEQELVEFYRTKRTGSTGGLILHAFDRLDPGSKTGGVYHRDPEHERHLKKLPPEEVQFRFWGNMDLDGFAMEKPALSHYVMVTCHSPANPTFAYEPSRVDPGIIQAHLRETRGEFRQGLLEGERVLEVFHRGRVLTFPPWKFDIIGPLRLLKFMIGRGSVCVLSAVDDEVFWEILSQLLADERYRPKNLILTPEVRPEVFGAIYKELMNLEPGERRDLSTLAPIRKSLSCGKREGENRHNLEELTFVEIRRGAVFQGVPSSFTAKQFKDMSEETPPWWVILVPSRKGFPK